MIGKTDSITQRYCATHGTPLDDDGKCRTTPNPLYDIIPAEVPTANKLATYVNGATRSMSKWAYSLIPSSALRALAERYWLGKLIHGSTNWLGGIPFGVCIDHMEEHLQRFKEGFKDVRRINPKDEKVVPFDYTDGDIEHLAAIMWGAAAIIHYITTGRSDLDDRQYKVKEK